MGEIKKGESLVSAYIFVILNSGTVESLDTTKIESIEGILEVTKVYGSYDLVIKAKFEELKPLQKLIKKIRNLKEVNNTTTMIDMNA